VLALIAGLLLVGPVAFAGVDAKGDPAQGRLALWVSKGSQEVRATNGDYHCVPDGPDEDSFGYCKDRRPGPLRLKGRLNLHACDDFNIKLGYPADVVRVLIEDRDQRTVVRLGRAEPVGETATKFRVRVSKLPSETDRFHLFVTHTDENEGDFEAGIRRKSSQCGNH